MSDFITKQQFDEFKHLLETGRYQFNHANRHRSGGGDVLPGGSLQVEEEDGSPTVAGVTRIKFSNGAVTDNGGGEVSVSTSGTGAPTTATYVTMSLNGSLSAERVLTGTDGISITDGGANSTVTVAQTGRIMQTYISFGSAIPAVIL
jgi:hypothetical protein